MNFELVGNAEILGTINLIRGNAEEADAQAQIKLRFDDQLPAPAAVLLGVGSDKALAHFHYPPSRDENQSPVFLGCASMASSVAFDDKHTLEIGGQKTRVAKVKSLELVPTAKGLWTVAGVIVIDRPSKELLATLHEHIHTKLRAELRQDPALDLKGGGKGDRADHKPISQGDAFAIAATRGKGHKRGKGKKVA